MGDRQGRIAGALVFAASVVLGGCYASSTLEEGASGGRVRRVVLRPDDGAALEWGWYDGELGADCGFRRAEDGRVRCLPLTQLLSGYEDPACSQPVLEVRDGACEEPRWVMETLSATWCSVGEIRRRILEVEGPELPLERVYTRRGGECVPLDRSFERARRAVPVDPARFVAADPLPGYEGAGPIVRQRFVAEDGATFLGGTIDRARGEGCGPPTYSRHLERYPCLPGPAAFTHTARGGEACDETWAYPRHSECAPFELAYGVVEDECWSPRELHVYRVGEPVPADEQLFGDACPWSTVIRPLHRASPADDAVPWLMQSLRGTGRLRLAVQVDEVAPELASGYSHYFDAELGAPCTLVPASDGFRCIPAFGTAGRESGTTPHVGTYFADDGCTELATVPTETPLGACLTPFIVSPAPSYVPCAPFSGTVHRVEGPLERVYRRDDDGSCVPEAVPGARALTEIPLESLPHVARTIE